MMRRTLAVALSATLVTTVATAVPATPASFDPVTMTALRANLVAREGQAASEGIGVRRWRAYAEQPEAVAPVVVATVTVVADPNLTTRADAAGVGAFDRQALT